MESEAMVGGLEGVVEDAGRGGGAAGPAGPAAGAGEAGRGSLGGHGGVGGQGGSGGPAGDTLAAVRRILERVLPGRGAADGDRALRDLGLDSLAATRLVVELRLACGVEVPMAPLADCRGAEDLAALVAAQQDTGGPAVPARSAELGEDPEAAFEPFPLTAIQQAYLAGRIPDLTDDPVGCHIYREFELDDVDPSRLERAWRAVVDRTPILRSVLTPEHAQRVLPQAPDWELPVHDAGDPLTVRDRLSHRRYEPGRWPPFAVELSRRPDGPDVVHLSIDAMVTDGRGLDLLLEQWWRAYTDPGGQPETPAAGVRDCVVALAEQARGPAWERDLAYWRERLADLPPGPTVPLTPHCTSAGPRRRPLTAALDAEQWAALRAKAAGIGVSPTALALSVFTGVLARHGAGEQFTLVLTTSARSRLPEAARDVVGPFTSTCVFVADAHQDPGELGRRLWEDLDHGLVSGIQALHAARIRDARLPVVFTSLLDESRPAPDDGFSRSLSYAVSQTSGVAVDAQMWAAADGLRLRWDVSEAVAPGVAEVWFAAFVNALAALCADRPELDIHRPLNELQQAYYVAAASGSGPWDGCQVYHAFDVENLDLLRLERAWAGMLADYEVLRTEVTLDGRLRIRAGAPKVWMIPAFDHSDHDHSDHDHSDHDHSDHDYAATLVSRAFPLGPQPRFDLRVTRIPGRPDRVHLTLDLIVSDGRSVHFLLRELFRRYADPTARPWTPEPYESFTAWQQEQRSSPSAAAWREHWRDQAASLPPGPPLPTSDAAGGERSRTRRTGRIAGWPRLRADAERRGITADALLTSVLGRALSTVFPEQFALPLVRWSDQFRAWRPGEFTVLSWVVHEQALNLWDQAAANQAVITADERCDAVSGLSEVRRASLRRNRGRSSGFPVVATGLLELAGEPLPSGVDAGPWATCTPDVSMDCIAMDCGDDELRVFWDVVDADFAPGTADAVFQDYLRLLRSLVDADADADADADTDTGAEVPTAMTAKQRHQILVEWNATQRPYSADGPIHLGFEEQARFRPDRIAVRWRGGTWTYQDLNRRANAFAGRLRALGVKTGDIVGISLRRGPDMVAAVYGVLKAGGAYLPLEPGLPAERALGMLAESRAGTLLTDGSAAWAPASGVVTLDVASVGPQEGTDTDPEPTAGVDDLAYVIYTSGSTGRPKGVMVTHRPVHNLFAWCRRTHGFDSSDLGLCVTSLGFDLSVFDLLGLLGMGAGVYLADEEQQKDPELLLDVLLGEPVTFWNSAPTTLAQLAPRFPAPGTPGAETLRLVFLSGDYTPLPLPARLAAAFPKATLVSLGGATEATVWSNHFPVGEVDPAWRSIPYGRPIDNCRYYVLDDALQPCPPGVEGDLFIAGDCLSAGYIGGPDLTAERFVRDPHADDGDSLMYRTGDRAAYLPDGVITFLGRDDGQVKIRGFRVELGEIEHRLLSHPGVGDVVVLARPDETGDRRLAAYVVPEGPVPPTVRELRRYAAQTLPDYMVPNLVGFLDRFPATANGKLDRGALPWPPPAVETLAALAQASVPDAVLDTDVASGIDSAGLVKELTALFAELLGGAPIDPAADLWDQGATSFTMVRVSALMRERHDRRIAVSALLAEPTVEGIARAIAGEDAPAGEAPVVIPDVDFFDPDSRAGFYRAHLNVRAAGVRDTVVALPEHRVAEEFYTWRATRRDFLPEPTPLADLGRLLSLLRPSSDGVRDRYLYPSAGDTYAVQVYVRALGDKVAGLPAGVYYYQPADHALRLVNATPSADRTAHFYYNREIHDRAAFEIHLVGQRHGIEPLYGPDADRYLAIEAGHIAQVLMTGQAAAGPGLCPIGAVADEVIRADLALDDGHRLLVTLLGGSVPRQAPPRGGPPPPYAARRGAPIPLPTAAGLATDPAPPVLTTAQAPASDAIADPATELALPTATIPAAASSPSASLPDPIAIVGMAGRFPGADDLDALWRTLASGRAAIGPPPTARAAAFGEFATVRGGYLPDIESFDSLRFRIAPVEAASLDPRTRQVLEAAWRCLQDAGRADGLGRLGRVGVFVGTMWPDFHVGAAEAWRAGEPATGSGIAADLPNRVSHAFGLTGPSVAVDTSCSSSFTALHLAVQSIRAGECAAAVVAGVNLIAHPHHLALLSGLDLMSAAAGSGAFDADAPGWTPGEGVAAVLLRPARDARADHDLVHAVIDGTWTGHVGTAARFGAPDAGQIADGLRSALAAARVTPNDIDYVECAAAGAPLADAAEVEALGRVFAKRDRPDPLPFGTVKPNLGHLEAASGMSQLAKVVLQLRHRRLAPTLVAPHRNPLIDWDRRVLRLTDTGGPWPSRPDRPGTPRALATALGATGSLAYVVLRGDGEENSDGSTE